MGLPGISKSSALGVCSTSHATPSRWWGSDRPPRPKTVGIDMVRFRRSIHSDAHVHAAYRDPQIRKHRRQWWGDEVLKADGTINRSAVAKRVFSDPVQRERLEALTHPIVARSRDRQMLDIVHASGLAAQPLAFIWDTPLLFEVGLQKACDAVVFVDAPREVRLQRVARSRGWVGGTGPEIAPSSLAVFAPAIDLGIVESLLGLTYIRPGWAAQWDWSSGRDSS